MTGRESLNGKPHVRFDAGEAASCTAEALLRRVHCRRQPEGRASVCAATSRRGSLLYKMRCILSLIVAAGSIAALATEPPKRIFNETDNQRAERMAWWRHDGSEIAVRNPVVRHGQQGDLKPVCGLTLPMQKPNVSVPVIEMFL